MQGTVPNLRDLKCGLFQIDRIAHLVGRGHRIAYRCLPIWFKLSGILKKLVFTGNIIFAVFNAAEHIGRDFAGGIEAAVRIGMFAPVVAGEAEVRVGNELVAHALLPFFGQHSYRFKVIPLILKLPIYR